MNVTLACFPSPWASACLLSRDAVRLPRDADFLRAAPLSAEREREKKTDHDVSSKTCSSWVSDSACPSESGVRLACYWCPSPLFSVLASHVCFFGEGNSLTRRAKFPLGIFLVPTPRRINGMFHQSSPSAV